MMKEKQHVNQNNIVQTRLR